MKTKLVVLIFACANIQLTIAMEQQPAWWQSLQTDAYRAIRFTFGQETQEEKNIRLLKETEKGNFNAVKWLIEHGAQVNEAQNHLGDSALILASQSNHPEIVQLLLLHDAQASWRDRVTRNTALHWAAMGGYAKVVNLLLTTISNKDAQYIRKHYYSALASLKQKEQPHLPKDIRGLIGKRIIDNLVNERMEGVEILLTIQEHNGNTPYDLFRWCIGHQESPGLDPILDPTNHEGRKPIRLQIRKNILNILFGEQK